MSPAVWIALLAVFLLLLAGRRRARNLRPEGSAETKGELESA